MRWGYNKINNILFTNYQREFMLPSFILSLREGLEAALVIGIVLASLRQMRRRDLVSATWAGTGSAALVSLLTAILLTRLGLELKDPGEAIFEGITMLLAAGILTWMIFWMSQRSRNMKSEIESSVLQASQAGKWSLFGLAFIAVLREGVELALFLTAATFSSSTPQTIVGGLLGLGTAILLGWSFFATTVRLDLRRFFQVTGFLLLLFAAGLVGRAAGELVQVGWIPALIGHVWDLGGIISAESVLGQTLGALFGYSASPSLMQVLVYAAYFGTVLIGLLTVGRKQRTVQEAPTPMGGKPA
jgi:high-affinity iron transporter